ncbi:hypothetical protein DL98DRAFT_611435 [Cadophora sp. DSE1049]|nr:hypothetical protein DL98DRAFT_611435 [Cadophora sp. DSE1049]
MSTDIPAPRPALFPAEPSPTFLNQFNQYENFRTLARCLDTRNLFNLRLVSKDLAENYRSYVHLRWDPNRRLKRFVNNPEELRSMMGRYDAIISGSFVLQFLDDVTWLESDLDIFVPKGNAKHFGEYLMEKEGYKQEREVIATDEYIVENIEKTTTYHRYDAKQDRADKIQVIATQKAPVLSLMNGFCTTAGMNIMTWSNVYSVFPEHTFLEPRTQYPLKSEPESSAKHLTKYTARGWKPLGAMLNPEPNSGSIRPNGIRRIGDSKSWKLSLDVADIISPSIPDFVIEHSYFYMSKFGMAYYTCDAAEYSNDALKYKYTGLVGHTSHCTFWRFVGHRLRIVTVAELLKLNPEQTPEIAALPALSEMMTPKYPMKTFMGRIQKPESWSYIDSQIPHWSKGWEAKSPCR